MKGYCFKNTITPQGWINDISKDFELGYAYETDTHFVHIYGTAKGLYYISPGMTTIERKSGLLTDWLKVNFGAEEIKELQREVGTATKGIWRPGITHNEEMMNCLNYDDYSYYEAEQTLSLLINHLINVFTYTEPDRNHLNVYGHKIRELLILSCTEFENQCLQLLRNRGLQYNRSSTNDYVTLKDIASLDEYSVKIVPYRNIGKYIPFDGWNSCRPTESLVWYDAYNKTKHDRGLSFTEATLDNALYAVSANIIMHAVRFGPERVFNSNTSTSSLLNQYFRLEFENPDITSFYLPKYKFDLNTRPDFITIDPYLENLTDSWVLT
jgi:hypothetical protein